MVSPFRVKITFDANLEVVNFLDVTLDLENQTYKPYKPYKPDTVQAAVQARTRSKASPYKSFFFL